MSTFPQVKTLPAVPVDLAGKRSAQVATRPTGRLARHPDTGVFLAVRGGPTAGRVLFTVLLLLVAALFAGLLLSLT